MESGDSMERDGVWIPLTPGKPIPTRIGLGLGLGLGFHSVQPMGDQHNCKEALNSGQGTGIKNLNEAFPFMGSLNATGYLEKNGINEMYELKAGVHEHEAELGVAEKDHKSNAADQHDKVPHSECNSKNTNGVHESRVGVDSVPTPSNKKDSRKRRNDGIDLNKKPSQRPRMKKHRPKILDDSKPKKVPKAQTPRVSTPRPKTPKPVTPNRAHERRKPAKKNTFTASTSYSYSDVVQDVQSASKSSSLIVYKSCKRTLDFNHHLVERESHYVGKPYEQPPTVNYDLGGFNFFGKIVTSKRNTPRRSRFQKKCLNDSDDLLGDNNNKQQCHQEVAETNIRRFAYFYQRRKKRSLISIPALQVYRRTFKANQCLQNSKKSGPNFPSIFKKQRAKRRKATINGNWWFIKAFEGGNNNVKRSLRKRIQTTLKSVNNTVDKSKNSKGVVKPDLYTSEPFLHVFLTKKRKRSIRHTRRRENIMEYPIFKAMPYESQKRRENTMELSLFNANTYESEKCFSRKEENLLKITECLQLQEVPIQTIESFTSSHVDVQLVDNSVDSMKSLQLQEVPVIESQSLVIESQSLLTENEAKPLSKKELNELYVREIVDYVRRKMENLDINGESKELVVRNGNFSGTLVKIDPPKKRKVLPKVNLDEETLRMWKLLMENDGSEPVEETDKEKEEWWERQRKVFRGRVDSFIAKMHLIQGDRRFSQWKGSVVDSVVGVYLTQNVSDHLSSSAFMSLAAKFPVKSTSKEVCNHGEVETSQELLGNNTNIDGGFSMNNETEKDMITSCADVSDATPTVKPEQDKPCVDGYSNTFRKLLDLEEVDYLKQFYSSGNDNGHLNWSKEGEEEQSATSLDLSISHEPCATILDLNVGLCEVSVFKNIEKEKSEGNEYLNHADGEFIVQEKSTTLEEKEEPINLGLCEISVFKNVERENNEGNEHLNHSDGEFIVQQKSTTLEEKEEPINVGLCEISALTNVEREKNESNEHLNHSDGEFIAQQRSTTLEEKEEPINMGLCEISVFKNVEREKNEGNEHLNHSDGEFIVQQKSTTLEEKEEPINVGLCEISVFKNVEREKNEGNEHLNHSDGEFIVQQKSTTLEEKEEPINVGLCEISVFKNVEREKNEGNEHLNHADGEFIVQEKSTTLEEKEEPINVGLCEISVFKNVEREKNEGNEHLNHSDGEFMVQQKSTTLEEEEEEPIRATPICTLNSEFTIVQKVDPRSTGKRKSGSDEKQETKTDWESLRRTYCKNERRETNENNMDAVDWDAVRRATVGEIAETIVERGMNNVLAARIKEFLERMVKDHGSIDLEWLRDVPPDKAKEFLLSIQGIGLKSVECVRLLTLHHLAFPVDTNVARVATRLGWVPLQPLPEEVQIHLLNAYPMMDSIQKYLFPRLCTLDQRTLYELHYQLITFGKVFCTKRSPNCNACPMRAECRHYASAFASARLALPGPKESTTTTSIIVPAEIEQNHSTLNTPPPPSFDLELANLDSTYHNAQIIEPIIEVPPSPEPEDALPIIRDIEDYYCDLDDEIPTIRLNTEEFRETLKDTIEVNSISIPEAEMSKAIVALTAKAASIPAPRMKYVAKLRTVHYVYELPDYHPSLAGFAEREHDDPTPYLLAIWLTDETSNSLEYNNGQEETVKGTILIPCRTANRGKFPLNGTYFQVNEVFADDETSHNPMEVPRCQLWNLPRRYLGCGTSATSIFKALSTSDIQRCFWKGSICVRGFNIKTRQPRPLHRRFHISTTAIAAENKRSGKR